MQVTSTSGYVFLGDAVMASREFGLWYLELLAIIDAEHPGYRRDQDAWRPYFNGDFKPREALAKDMKERADAR